MAQRRQKYLAKMVVPGFSMLLLFGCASHENHDEKDAIAALPELSQTEIQKLQPVPNTHLLATRVMKLAPDTTTAPVTPPPPCPADDITTYYTAEVSAPVSVCRAIYIPNLPMTDGFVQVRNPTSKLPVVDLPVAVGVAVKNWTAAEGQDSSALVCRTENGPWQGALSSEHGCFGTCSPVNTLVLLNTPNLIEVGWDGSPLIPPTDFQYVTPPKETGQNNFGSCHRPSSTKRK